ncbi:MAG: class I poly(R)-hydroxyalkanoic acid synthase [Hyphomicrobiales bacterium]
MNDQRRDPSTDFRLADPAAFVRNLGQAMEKAAKLATVIAERKEPIQPPGAQLESAAKAFGEIARSYLTDPEKLADAQFKLWQQHARLWQSAWKRFLGEDVEPVVKPDRGDRRFSDPDWEQNQVFDFLKQSYLITAKWAYDLVIQAKVPDPHTKHKARFYVEQVANALAPSNFALTNPEVLKLTLATNGENLVEGLENLLRDFSEGGGELKIRQTDFSAFAVGKNLALTPGKVVYQNDIIQLIQYTPTTAEVYRTPLVIFPPWINKFYILDLNPKKSFIRWAVEQGLTVFVVSWVNPDEALARKTFADYMQEGILAALSAVEQATGERKVNAIGYCIGGTLLAATLGYMAAKGDDRIQSATFFTTQVDFEKAGDLLVFVDEEQVSGVEHSMAERGYLEGKKMSQAFNMLRSNDLIWSYVINNYLKGKDPVPFDLLFWNGDPTRMPAATHSFYLRECYLNNAMTKGTMVLDGVKIDLKKVKIPVYNLGAREDHIAPLPSVFRIGHFLGGDTRLVVSGSGHIAGVINPPEAKKYQYWTNDRPAASLEDWLKGATEHPGSWWPDWLQWVAARSGDKVRARVPGDGQLKPLEDAPGSFVKIRAD